MRAISPIWYVAAAVVLGAAAFLLFFRDAYNRTSEAEVIYAPGDSKLSWACPYWAFRAQGAQQYGLFSIEGRLVPDPGTIRPQNSFEPPPPNAAYAPTPTPRFNYKTAHPVPTDPYALPHGFIPDKPRSDGVNSDDLGKTLQQIIGGPTDGSSLSGDLGFGRKILHDDSSNKALTVNVVFRVSSLDALENKLRAEGCMSGQ
jgi:hypothetical protein